MSQANTVAAKVIDAYLDLRKQLCEKVGELAGLGSRAAVISKTRINMHRKLRNMATMTGLYPLAVLSDCVVYPSPGASPLDFLPHAGSGKPQPGGFRLGPTPGLAKLEGVQPMLWAVDPMEKDHNPAHHIKDRDTPVDEGE